jgi:hypothetical protein
MVFLEGAIAEGFFGDDYVSSGEGWRSGTDFLHHSYLSQMTGVTVGSIQTIETLKASGLESDAFAKFAGYYAKALNMTQDLGLQSQVLTILPALLSAVTTTS